MGEQATQTGWMESLNQVQTPEDLLRTIPPDMAEQFGGTDTKEGAERVLRCLSGAAMFAPGTPFDESTFNRLFAWEYAPMIPLRQEEAHRVFEAAQKYGIIKPAPQPVQIGSFIPKVSVTPEVHSAVQGMFERIWKSRAPNMPAREFRTWSTPIKI